MKLRGSKILLEAQRVKVVQVILNIETTHQKKKNKQTRRLLRYKSTV